MPDASASTWLSAAPPRRGAARLGNCTWSINRNSLRLERTEHAEDTRHASVYVPYKQAGNGDLIKGFEHCNQMPYAEARKAFTIPSRASIVTPQTRWRCV